MPNFRFTRLATKEYGVVSVKIMNYSLLGLVTSFLLVAVLAGCIPPSKDIIATENRLASTVDLAKTSPLVPITEFDPPPDANAKEDADP